MPDRHRHQTLSTGLCEMRRPQHGGDVDPEAPLRDWFELGGEVAQACGSRTIRYPGREAASLATEVTTSIT